MRNVQKVGLLLFFLGTALAANAQVLIDGVLADSIDVPYLQLNILRPGSTVELNVDVDFGQEGGGRNPYYDESVIEDADGKRLYFSSIVEALAFFHRHGWVVEEMTTSTLGENPIETIVIYHYLLEPKKSDQ